MKRPNHQESQEFSPELPSHAFSQFENLVSQDILSNLNDTGDRITPRERFGINKKDFTGMVTFALDAIQHFEDELTSKYQSSYDSLVKSRASNGKVVPPLKDILRNMQQLSDSRRKENASALISKEFSDIDQVKATYGNPEKLEERKSTILELHNLTVEKDLQPFDLGKPDHISLVSQGMKKVRDSLHVSPAQARAVYERLADYGYLGTVEEIKKVKEKLDNLEDLLDTPDGMQIFFGSFIGVLIGFLSLFIIAAILTNNFQENLNQSMPTWGYIISSIFVILAYIGFGAIFDETPETLNSLTYSYNKPRQLILRHKLHQLEKRDDLINTAQQLLRQTAGVHEEYEDLDSIKNTKDIKKLVERLGVITALTQQEFKEGKKFDFAYLDQYGDEDLKWMIEQIRDNDKKQIEENALKMIEILTQGEYNQTHIEEIKVKVYKDLEENGRIKLPTDVIVLQNPVNEYKYIQSLDELVSTLNISPEQLKEFEHIKDQVHVKEKSLLELHSYVATLTEMKEETLDYNEVKENIEPLLDQMHLTEAQKTNYADMLRVYSPTRGKDKGLSHNSKSEGSKLDNQLDLDELKKTIEERKKKQEVVLGRSENQGINKG